MFNWLKYKRQSFVNIISANVQCVSNPYSGLQIYIIIALLWLCIAVELNSINQTYFSIRTILHLVSGTIFNIIFETNPTPEVDSNFNNWVLTSLLAQALSYSFQN